MLSTLKLHKVTEWKKQLLSHELLIEIGVGPKLKPAFWRPLPGRMFGGARIWIAALIFCCVNHCFSQYMDTIRTALSGKRSVDFGFDSRNTFVDHNRTEIQSIKLGVEFGNKISVGTGFAWLNSQTPVFDVFPIHDALVGNNIEFVNRRLTFHYVRFYVNYIYYRTRRWEFSIPLQAGIGKLGFKYTYNNSTVQSDEGYCFLYEPEIDVKFKVCRWLGAEGDIGYRFLFRNNSFIKHTFNSPLISLGVFVVWSEIALALMPHNKWVQEKWGPSEW